MRVTTVTVVQQAAGYRWYMLTLATLTFTFVMGIPTMSLPVLFEEIAGSSPRTL